MKLKIYHANVAHWQSRPQWADRPAEMTASRPPVEVLRASSYTPRGSMALFARGLPQLGRAAHGPLRAAEDGSQVRCYSGLGSNLAGLQPRWKCKNGRD
jgi:hypothetical protein